MTLALLILIFLLIQRFLIWTGLSCPWSRTSSPWTSSWSPPSAWAGGPWCWMSSSPLSRSVADPGTETRRTRRRPVFGTTPFSSRDLSTEVRSFLNLNILLFWFYWFYVCTFKNINNKKFLDPLAWDWEFIFLKYFGVSIHQMSDSMREWWHLPFAGHWICTEL